MARPSRFPRAAALCAGAITVLYAAFGALGYAACGAGVADIALFSFTNGRAARAAGALVLAQALAQCELCFFGPPCVRSPPPPRTVLVPRGPLHLKPARAIVTSA